MSEQVKMIDAGTSGELGETPRPRPPRLLLERLRAVVLLAGGVRETQLSSVLPGSVLELPLQDDITVFDHVLAQADQLAGRLDRRMIDVRVLIGRQGKQLTAVPRTTRSHVSVERDPFDYRGTGGVLRDIAEGYDDDDVLLVANGSQVFLDPLPELVTRLEAQGGDIALVAHRDGTPSGLMLMRSGCLKLIPQTGFIDMKEQALPIIARDHRVMVLTCETPSMLPVRTLSDYLNALRAHHRALAGRPVTSDPFLEDFQPTFAIVQDGARVDPSARVHDAIVLRGARVEAGAILVRSLISAGGVVRREQRVVDRLIGSPIRARRLHNNGEAAHD